jgi:hypothetical protein
MIGYFYEREIKAFNRNRIKYLVVGGMAVNLYGVHRQTNDLDLMINLSHDNFNKFMKVVGALGYYTKIPVKKWKEAVAIAFRDRKDEDKRIDVFLKNPIDFDQAYKHRKIFKPAGFKIPCVSLGDLLAMKNKADRLRDWIDIGSLKRMMELKRKK